MDRYKNNPEKSSATNMSEYIPGGFSMSTISLFKGVENNHDIHRSKYCVKRFCDSSREYGVKIINFEKKK